MERKEVGGDDLDFKSPHIRLNDREREREKCSYLDIAKSFIQQAGVRGQEDLALSAVYFVTVTNRNTVCVLKIHVRPLLLFIQCSYCTCR